MVKAIPTDEYFSLVREQLSLQGKAFVRVTGNSMQPLLYHLRDGAVIVPPSKIRTGDIVLYDRHNGRFALHRVIWKGKTSFKMAGDNQYYIDKNLNYDQIVGVVSEIERKGKRISCNSFGLRLYSFWVIVITGPRIFFHKVAAKIKRILFRSGGKAKKGDQ